MIHQASQEIRTQRGHLTTRKVGKEGNESIEASLSIHICTRDEKKKHSVEDDE